MLRTVFAKCVTPTLSPREFHTYADAIGQDVEVLYDGQLTGVNLTDADLTGADLTGADLTGADLPGQNN